MTTREKLDAIWSQLEQAQREVEGSNDPATVSNLIQEAMDLTAQLIEQQEAH